jgi:hypothetical protein
MGENNNMYCGIGPIPKGKIRATPEYCVQTNQVRYYGLKLIDKDLLKQAKGKTTSLIKEQLKLKKIEDNAKILVKDVRNLKVILEDELSKPSQQKKAQKKMDELLVKRDRLVKQLKAQKIVVDAIEKQENKIRKASGSKTKKSSSGSKKSSSGSKKSKK